MLNLSRSEDKKALAGTITVYLLLFLLLFLMSMFNACSDLEAEEISSGGVAVSIGNPDDGGPDNSAAKEETIPESKEEYTPENQLTSDVAEAPPIVNNKAKTKPKETAKSIEDKPKETKPKPKPPKINIGKNKGKDTKGSGKGSNNTGGYKGKPDGTGASPDGEGKGTSGMGSGDGPSLGPGVSGGIGGFSAKIALPQGGVQENGKVRLYVCVDSKGNVISAKYRPLIGDYSTTTNSDLKNRAIYSIKKSTFRNISGSDGGCGYITYTFKLQ